MYGYCASSDGDSTSSFPGARTKNSRQKRVSSLGKLTQTPKLPPVPILPLLQQLRDTAKNGCNETSVNDNSDMSLSFNSDASYIEDGGEVMGLNSCGRYRDGAERLSSSYEGLSPNMKVDESFGTNKLDITNMQHSEKLRDHILTSQAVKVSESHKYDAYVGHIESSAKKMHCSVELFSQDSNHKKGVYDHISDSFLLTGDKEKILLYRESAVTELHRKNSNFQKECSSINNGVISNKGPVFQDIINLPDIIDSKLGSKNIKQYEQFEKKENKQSNSKCKTNYVDYMPLNFTTPAKNNFTSYSSSIKIHGNDKMFHLNSITPNLTAKEDFKTPARKNMDCVTLLQPDMKENVDPSDIFNSNSERELETLAEKSSRLESQLHHDNIMFDRGTQSFSRNVKQNILLVDDLIPVKQDVSDQKCSTGNSVVHSDSRLVERSATTNSQSLLLLSDRTDEANTVINAQEYIVMPTVHKSDCGIVQEKSPKENENDMSKVVEKEGKFIIVNGKEYIIQCVLGRGGSSEVLQVLIPNTSRLLAMKRVKLSVAEPAVAQGYLNEIALLRRLQGSETVIRMMDFEYMKEKQLLYVIMEKGETDLSKLIKDISKTNQIPMTTIVYYWVEMLRAVKNIHANGIIHSDLKPANFLLVCGRLKLIDFGIASSLQTDMTSVFKDTPTGTFNYMSPEAIPVIHTGNGNQSLTKISYKSDIWSLGCILYNLIYGKTPFQHIVHIWAKLAAITNPDHNIDYSETRKDCLPILLKVVKQCLTYDPKKRPTAAELLEMPYLNYNMD